MGSADDRLQRLWYGPAWRSLPLWPLSLPYRAVVGTRAALYRSGALASRRIDVPVVVVGNVTVGGTGKTPVAGWVARQLALRGHRVGVVLRGYGGSHRGAPRRVRPDDAAAEVGDEALLHARQGVHAVVIGADRAAAAALAAEQGADVVVSDDGLQHLRLARDVEIAVVDGERGLGNGCLLPAGPLREPAARLGSVHAIVVTERGPGRGRDAAGSFEAPGPLRATARLQLGAAVNLRTGERRPLEAFRDCESLHAVAGIGHPGAFFAALAAAGLRPVTHPLPDHAGLKGTLPFAADATVLMTQKDAVKCTGDAPPDWWWVELEVGFDRADADALLTMILTRTGLAGAGVPLG
jgi:tetraacyldisaccharide 4'-kinase